MKTRIDIFSGFLGAGKTMLIKKLIKDKLSEETIVVIENEFGEVGIDGLILEQGNINVKEINKGCICCSVVGDLKIAIMEVIDKYSPSRVIIEPSGVGKLSEVINACKSNELKDKVTINMVITVIDTLKFNTYIENFDEFYKNQIVNAKTIVLSRTQKTTVEKTQHVMNEVRKLNPMANIITTSWEYINGKRIVEVAETNISLEKELKVKRMGGNKRAISIPSRAHSANDIFETWSIETSKIYTRDRINSILYTIEDSKIYGSILRAKGIFQIGQNEWIQFDYVPGEIEMKFIEADYSGRVCVIGCNLKKEKIEQLFNID